MYHRSAPTTPRLSPTTDGPAANSDTPQLLRRIAELERINASQATVIKGFQQTLKDRKRPGIDIYTDGACSPNPGTGGWGFVVVDQGQKTHEQSGGPVKATTNNRMEMTAAVEALAWLRKQGVTAATIHSDSKLMIKTATGRWVAKKNRDLAKALLAGQEGLTIRFKWVKSHAGNHWNTLADKLAGEAAGAPSRRPHHIRATGQTDRPKRGWRAPGTFGAASGVRHIDPADYEAC